MSAALPKTRAMSARPDPAGPPCPDPAGPSLPEAGLYVHIPFCLTRCGYCDFNAYAGMEGLAGPYVEALVKEARLRAPEWEGTSFVSVFLGGGTPSTVPARALAALLDRVRDLFAVLPGAEVTVEANPDTVEEGSLEVLLEAGVTRLSMGAQSFDPAVLRALERVHSPGSVRSAFAAARRAGFANVNLDLIYGAHGETLSSWARTLDRALELGPEHLSCYALTIEPSTPLGRRVAAGAVPAPDPDRQAEMYDVACRVLAESGYEHYEVSNWAVAGRRCRHNLGYWEGRPYLGLGAGAHSYRDGRRWWNVRPPEQYRRLVDGGRLPVGGEERLGEEEGRLERLLLGLRLADGVPQEWVDPARAGELVAGGLARWLDGRFALTERGLFLANEVVLAVAGAPSRPLGG